MNRPQREKVYLSKMDSEVTLNFMTLADDKFVHDTWGDNADKLFRTLNLEMILGLFWRLIDDESKKKIHCFPINQWNGFESVPAEFNSPIEKLKHIVASNRELIVIWNAINETRRKSDPEPLENDVKKKTVESP